MVLKSKRRGGFLSNRFSSVSTMVPAGINKFWSVCVCVFVSTYAKGPPPPPNDLTEQ